MKKSVFYILMFLTVISNIRIMSMHTDADELMNKDSVVVAVEYCPLSEVILFINSCELNFRKKTEIENDDFFKLIRHGECIEREKVEKQKLVNEKLLNHKKYQESVALFVRIYREEKKRPGKFKFNECVDCATEQYLREVEK